MSYAKLFWTPNETDVGAYWKGFFNKYLKQPIGCDMYASILESLRDPESDDEDCESDTNDAIDFFAIGYDLVERHGDTLFETLTSDTTRFRFGVSDYPEDLMRLRSFLCDKVWLEPPEEDEYGLDPATPIEVIGAKDVELAVFTTDEIVSDTDLLPRLRKAQQWVTDEFERRRHGDTNNGIQRACKELRPLMELRTLRAIVIRTWGISGDVEPWTDEDLDFLNRFICQNRNLLRHSSDTETTIDPGTVSLEMRVPA